MLSLQTNMYNIAQNLHTANDVTVTKFLHDQVNGDISVTKFLAENDISVTKFLKQAEDDISVTKFLASNDITVTKFLDVNPYPSNANPVT